MRIESPTWHAKHILIFSVKFVVPQLPHPSAFLRDLVLDMQVILGSAEAVHYLPLKPRPEGPPGPCPIIQTGHLTPLPSHDYRSPFCRQCSFTERTWWDSGTHLHNSQLLFIIFPSWAQDLTWPDLMENPDTEVSVSEAKHVRRIRNSARAHK